MKVLDRAVGKWRNEITVRNADAPDKRDRANVLIEARPILAGRFIEGIETNEADGSKDYWLTWYDVDQKTYRFWFFAHGGEATHTTGTWDEAKQTMRWKNEVLDGHWTFKNDGLREVAWTIRDKDRKWIGEVEGVSRRLDKPEWIELFNHKDLAGWKNHPDQPGKWKVEDGMLVGRARKALLYSNRGDYGDFDLHIEAKVNNGGDGGIYIRTPEFPPIRKLWSEDPKGHRVVLASNPRHDPAFKTGSMKTWRAQGGYLVQACDGDTPPDQWFTVEILARGPEVTVRVNGKKTAQLFRGAEHNVGLKGFLVLEANTDDSVIQIRKIEIRELAAEP
jgi:hypothetical protein